MNYGKEFKKYATKHHGISNMYYDKIMSLANMTDHIYGRDNVITRQDRPNLFIKELHIYMDYLKNKIDEAKISMNKKEEKYLKTFTANMKSGVSYYKNLFNDIKSNFESIKTSVLVELDKSEAVLNQIQLEIQDLAVVKS